MTNEPKTPVFFSPTSDWGFKRLFGTPSNERLLIYLLNTIIEERTIVKATFLNTEHNYMNVKKGRSTFDVYCICDDDRRIIVECQTSDEGNFLDRAFVYSSLAVLDQAKPHWDYNLDALYFVAFLTYNQFKGNDKCITKAKLMDIDVPGRVVYNNYLQIFVELPKFVSNDKELNSARDQLLYILKNLRNMTGIPGWVENGQNETLKDICQTALFDQLSTKEKDEYMLTEEKERIYQRSIEYAAKVNRDEGREEGLKKGKTDVAKAMKLAGEPIEKIVLYSGLTAEQVQEL